ncbi:6-bladed beta-propeller [Parabacteroides sp.]|uniref:6-bladed beta-propeller n=1 Tax=Parabacteroides sp. TaxID=1869337 RepID=UPI0026E0189D|nr:6-bladed beta-propeller [Parabacteroides sp.]MDO5427947.1 6-bladed beta-propeller [Parabacteroides sp.]
MNKILCFVLMVASCYSCSSNSTTEKYHNKRDNIVNVHDQIKEIVIEDVLIGYYSWPMIIDNYIFIIDYRTANEFIHIFNKNDFKYVTSTAFKGQGPGEIANIGYVAEDKMNRKFYVSDHGKNRIFTYDMDSVISDPAYLPIEKMIMGDQVFPTDYVYINDTLSIGVTIQRLGNGNFNPIVAKFNMKTGEISPMSYTIHPDVKKKRICFAISLEHGIYVETYVPHDLMTICGLDGKLKYNIYGTEWDTETHGINYYGSVAFCNNRIVALYSGEKSITKDRKAIFSTKFIVFDLEGNYLKTLETNCPIIRFCYDKDNDRLIMSIDNEMQFAYLDVGNLLD